MHTSDGNVENHADVSDGRRLRKLRPQTEKVCIYCKVLKPASEYNSHQYTTRTGRISTRLVSGCKPCNRKRIDEYRARVKPAYYAKAKEWRDRNKERRSALQRARRAADPIKARAQYLRQYGLTLESYDAMREAQGDCCACCHSKPQRVGRKGAYLHVDHCHQTGIVRGLLCHQCNVILGLSKDSPATLRRLADYLEKPRQSSDSGGD